LHHHWRQLLSLVGKFLSYVATALSVGDGCCNVRRIVAAINAFKERQRQDPIELRVWGLQEFFPNVSVERMRQAVDCAILRVQRQHPGTRYF